MKQDFEVNKHFLVPKHELLNDKDKEKLLETYSISIQELPKIYKKDPAIVNLKAKSGDIIKITRQSPTAGESVYYRVVIDG